MKISGSPANSICLLTLFFLLSMTRCFAQSSSGPRNGSVFSNDNTVGSYSFSVPSNASTHDNNYASASAILSVLSGTTHYLKSTGFGFSIPSGTGITGIVVEVEKHASNINFLTSVEDNSVRLVKNGVITGSNKAKAPNWVSSPAYYTYGASNDLWGATWTTADINSANFGVVFSARINGLVSLLPNANIEHIRITVYYNIVLPMSQVEFTATAKDHHSALLHWTAAGEDIASINVQRATAADNWKTIHTVQNFTASKRTYEYLDADCTEPLAYYRLQAIYFSGKKDYTMIVPVKWENSIIAVYPNPASHELFIKNSAMDRITYCTAMDGRQWSLNAVKSGQQYRVDIRHLPKGIYTIRIDDKKELFIKN